MPRSRASNILEITPPGKRTPIHPYGRRFTKRIGKRKRESSSEESSLSKKFGELSTATKPPAKRLKPLPAGGVLEFETDDDDPIALYFEAFSKPAQKTSANKITDLNLPSKKILRNQAKELHEINEKATEELLDKYKSNWGK